MMKDLMNGRTVRWNDQELELAWARNRPEIPMYLAGYGPGALAVAGRVSDGVIIQLTDPEIVDWIMGIARKAAEEDGRDPDALAPIACAPAFVSADLERARDQVRWFPAMVSKHVMDLLARYDESELPAPLFGYVKQRDFYDYRDRRRAGAEHGRFVDDDTYDRFCILGTPEQHIEKLKALEAIGVRQWNIYLMAGDEERTLDVYGQEIITAFS